MDCPKCGYVREDGDSAPDWQCPSCGVAYAKARSGREEEARAERSVRSGGALIGKFLLVVAAVAVAWALLPGPHRGPALPPPSVLANARIVMYSLTTCGYCNQKRAQLQARGVPFVEYFIDIDPVRKRELFEKLLVSGYRGGGIGTPTFEVNGKMLPNNPSLDTIFKHL